MLQNIIDGNIGVFRDNKDNYYHTKQHCEFYGCLFHFGCWELYLYFSRNVLECKPFALYPCDYSAKNPSIPIPYYMYTFAIIPEYGILTNIKIRCKYWELFYINLIGNWIILGALMWHANQLIYFLHLAFTDQIFDHIVRFISSSYESKLIKLENVLSVLSKTKTKTKDLSSYVIELQFRSRDMNKYIKYFRYLKNYSGDIKIDNILLFASHPAQYMIMVIIQVNIKYIKANGNFTNKIG